MVEPEAGEPNWSKEQTLAEALQGLQQHCARLPSRILEPDGESLVSSDLRDRQDCLFVNPTVYRRSLQWRIPLLH